MFTGRLQVLSDREEIDIRDAQVVHELEDLFALLAKSDHDAGFREDRRIELFDPLEQPQRVEIARTGPDRQVV